MSFNIKYGKSAEEVLPKNVENLSLWGYYVKCLKNYAKFRGRARRKEFWGFFLFNFIIYLGFQLLFYALDYDLLDIMAGYETPLWIVPYCLYSLAVLLPSWAVIFRRLHDVGKSGWWLFAPIFACILVIILPFGSIGFIFVYSLYLLYLFCKASCDGKNLYGPNPLKPEADYELASFSGVAVWGKCEGILYLMEDKLCFEPNDSLFNKWEIYFEQIKDVNFYKVFRLIPNRLAITALDGEAAEFAIYDGKLWKEKFEKLKVKG